MTAMPVELARFDLDAGVEPPGGVTVGTPEDELKREMGYVAVDVAGQAQAENITSILRHRLNVRCIHSTEAKALELAHTVREYLHERGRRVVEQESDGKEYLIHRTWVTGGPQPAASPNMDLFEFVLFADYLIGVTDIQSEE